MLDLTLFTANRYHKSVTLFLFHASLLFQCLMSDVIL